MLAKFRHEVPALNLHGRAAFSVFLSGQYNLKPMEAKIFSYKVTGIKLGPLNDILRVSQSFDRKKIMAELKDILMQQNFKPDEHSLDYKIVDGELFIEGLAVENQEPKTMGFMAGK